MLETTDLAALGRLLAAPARAAMVDALFDGRAWSVGELADAARVSPSTASEHLQALAAGGLVAGLREGRHRRYRLASDEIAGALESLSTLAPLRRSSNGLRAITRGEAMRAARTCYDHLAGRLGVAVADGLVQADVLRPAAQSFAPTAPGEGALAAVGIDLGALARTRRPTALACLDWSERRPHLAGALGAALLGRLEAIGGLERLAPGRAVRLLPPGRALLGSLGVTGELA
jgi:DNA-binding transcriptional ArsR family regulator